MAYTLSFVLTLFAGATVAGFFGSLLGIGGGVFIVPLMVLVLHLPMKVAVAASIVAVIATSNAGGSRYVEQRITNLKVAMLLEVATTLGALAGAILALYLAEWLMLLVFSVLLVNMAWSSFATRKLDDQRIAEGSFANIRQDGLSRRLNLRGCYFDQAGKREVDYAVTGVWPGSLISLLAGVTSGMLGIGGGALKVSAMNRYMNIPMKAAVGTSKLMIGITAAVSATLFFVAGALQFSLVGPVALGTTCGATVGSKVMNHLDSAVLKKILTVLMLYMAYSMTAKALELHFHLHLPNL
jgi:hypothetical protein